MDKEQKTDVDVKASIVLPALAATARATKSKVIFDILFLRSLWKR